jgi:hypothetical protein
VWSADDNDLDRTIDTVARQMTAGEPSANLRARVIDRLETPRATRRLLWIGVPIAAAATLVIALVVMRGWRSGVERAPELVAQNPTPSVAPPRAPVTVAPAIAADGSTATVSRIRRRTSDERRPASPPSDVAALAPEGLDVTSIELTAINPAESIRLPRLETIEPIAVQPIGDPQGDRP